MTGRWAWPTLGAGVGLWVLGMATAPVAVAQQSWDFYYRLGLQQLRNGDPRGAIESLTNALRRGPPPGPRRPTSGGQLVNFFPYLYLARAYLALQDCDQARRMIETSAQMGEVPKDHPDYTLQFVPTQQNIRKACGPPPEPGPEAPSPGKAVSVPPPTPEPEAPPPKQEASAPPPPSPPVAPGAETPAVRPAVPVEVVRQAVRLYRQGAYRDVVRLLFESQRTYELDDSAYFLVGCSLAARYFWEGQRDRRLLQEARTYFQRVQTLPPSLQAVVPDLVSPKVRAVYEAARRTGRE
ncbi:hypothetical protein HRbin11_01072 [bacterium HR11]|nr:hypothetical protein HRbin11_01072 [bacterium HR11]